jgi:adenylate cyclase class 2
MFCHVRRGAPLAVALVAAAGRDLMAGTMSETRFVNTEPLPMSTPPVEREIKLRFASAEDARAAVLALGATPLLGRRLQEDALLDTPEGLLRDRRSALRIRMENGKSRVTFKGPVQLSTMKVREEVETVVGDGEVLLRIFGELGLQVWFRYEKYREEFSYDDVIVAIDETPVGVYVEIEGSEHGIEAAAAALGRTSADYIVDSYRALFLQERERLGTSAADMMFDTPA